MVALGGVPILPIVVVVLACALFFVVAFVAPRASRKPQETVDRKLSEREERSADHGSWPSRLLAKGFGRSRDAADTSAEKGREARGRVDGTVGRR